jgi:hypothetical protein
MTTEIATAIDARGGLTADLIKTMRMAENIVFMALPVNGETEFGLRLERGARAKVDGIDGPMDVQLRTEVTLDGSFEVGWDDRQSGIPYRRASSFLFYNSRGTRRNHDLATFLAFLKPGDVIRPVFFPNTNRNGYMERATTGNDGALFCDLLRVFINRTREGKPTEYYSFLLDIGLCPDNSARMVRA